MFSTRRALQLLLVLLLVVSWSRLQAKGAWVCGQSADTSDSYCLEIHQQRCGDFTEQMDAGCYGFCMCWVAGMATCDPLPSAITCQYWPYGDNDGGGGRPPCSKYACTWDGDCCGYPDTSCYMGYCEGPMAW
jgi:hypothetical protein